MKRDTLVKLVELAMLVSIMLMLHVFGLDFIFIPPVSVTTLIIPVIVGAIILGPWEGAVLGLVFGLLSLWSASISPLPTDQIFSPFLSGNPIGSFVMCILTRVIFGFVTGGLFYLLRRKSKLNIIISVLISSVVGVFVHTSTVMLAMWLFEFENVSIVFKDVISGIFSINLIAEITMAIIFGIAFSKVVPLIDKRKL